MAILENIFSLECKFINISIFTEMKLFLKWMTSKHFNKATEPPFALQERNQERREEKWKKERNLSIVGGVSIYTCVRDEGAVQVGGCGSVGVCVGGKLGIGQEKHWQVSWLPSLEQLKNLRICLLVNYCAKATYQFSLRKAQNCKLRPGLLIVRKDGELRKMVCGNLAGMES